MIENLYNEYRNEFAQDNVYGHAVALLRDNLSSDPLDKGVHLDLGCGYGAIAEHIAALGRTYVGVDANPRAVDSLLGRSFEAHCAALDATTVRPVLERIIKGRRVSSISLIDTLEHLAEGQEILQAVYEIACQDNALFVVSVPNVAHRDIGFKLAAGRIDYTEAGLLDHTHTRMYDESALQKALRSCGFRVIAANHVKCNHSDQFFPKTHPVLQEATTLRSFLKQLRAQVDGNDIVNQLVVAGLPGERLPEPPFVKLHEEKRPFITLVTRTQGKRIQNLTEYLTCMLGQTDRDFEILVVGHKLTVERQIAVEQVIEDLPEWLRQQVRLVRVDYGNRTHPLNVGFQEARGEYIAIHDDDDLPLGHWVESFRKASLANPGRVLRCVSVIQSVERTKTGGLDAIRAVGPYKRQCPVEFDFFEHVTMNRSPNNTIAFPRGLFEDLNFSFDEELTTTEDWDLILRAAALVGVSSISEITGIYQWASENSIAAHSQEEWKANELRVVNKLNRQPLLLPSGSFLRLRTLLDNSASRPASGNSAHRERLLREIALIFESTSWKITGPIRWAGRILKQGKPVRVSEVLSMTDAQLEQLLQDLLSSTSWRLASPMRRFRSR